MGPALVTKYVILVISVILEVKPDILDKTPN